jgi:hypothetical protein
VNTGTPPSVGPLAPAAEELDDPSAVLDGGFRSR